MFIPSPIRLLRASLVLALYPRHAFSTPFHQPNSAIRTVYQFPNLTWIENIAVRSDGQLLVTILTSPELHVVNPFTTHQGETLLARFPSALGALGIAEIERDVFAVITGNFSIATLQVTAGSFSVWKVDLQKSRTTPKVTKIADVAQSSFPNGMVALRSRGRTTGVLISDSSLGVVWRVDVNSGESVIVLDNALMKPVPGALPIGINGLKLRDGVLYFVNSGQGLFAKVPIRADGTAAGEFEVVARNGPGDDFALDKRGNAFVATNTGDSLQLITPAGEVRVLAGSTNETVLEGDTAAQFGRTQFDKNILYVTTNGGMVGLVPGTQIEGGKIVALDIPTLRKTS